MRGNSRAETGESEKRSRNKLQGCMSLGSGGTLTASYQIPDHAWPRRGCVSRIYVIVSLVVFVHALSFLVTILGMNDKSSRLRLYWVFT